MRRIILALTMAAALAVTMLLMAPSAFAAEGPKPNAHGCVGLNTAAIQNKHSEFIEAFPGAKEPPRCQSEVEPEKVEHSDEWGAGASTPWPSLFVLSVSENGQYRKPGFRQFPLSEVR